MMLRRFNGVAVKNGTDVVFEAYLPCNASASGIGEFSFADVFVDGTPLTVKSKKYVSTSGLVASATNSQLVFKKHPLETLRVESEDFSFVVKTAIHKRHNPSKSALSNETKRLHFVRGLLLRRGRACRVD